MVFRTRTFPLCSVFTAAWLCLVLTLASADDKSLRVREPWTKSRITGTPEPPAPYRLALAFPKIRFQRPTNIEPVPGSNRLLVTEMGGKIFTFANDEQTSHLDLAANLGELLPQSLAGRNVSLFDAEFHPKFSENQYLFVCYVHPGEGGHTRVSRLTVTKDSPPRIAPNSEHVVITWPSGGHNGGCLEFGKDGFLYIATGDGSGPNPPDGLTTGQDVSDLLGAILRIDVDHVNGDQPYAIPTDNPFVGAKQARPEIWSYGLRNPWKFGIDSQSGDVFVADNGWESWEMVHRIVRGGNCGWPVMEGRASLRSEVKPGPTPIIPPIKDHPHTEANSVIGGPVYRGEKLPDLDGSFVYGDYITGTIWSVRRNKGDSYSQSTLVDTDQRIVAFTQGSRGELFVLDYDFTGQIYELLPSGLKDTSANFPRRLSETGLFTSLESMQPAPGVVPYAVQAERWMDGATGERWIAIPGVGTIQLAAGTDRPAVYPEGTVLVKHLSLPQGDSTLGPIRLETQLLHYENGIWHPYSYLWDEGGKDASLVDSTGKKRPFRFNSGLAVSNQLTERTWHVNAVNECKLCHNAESGFVLGFVPNQLNRAAIGDSTGRANQVEQLAAHGVLSQPIQIADNDAARLVDPHDSSQSLDDRARSYLHANCSMCHQPGGNAIVSFYLRRDLPFDKLNTNKGTGIGTFGMRNPRIIVPGDPYRSLLLYRMSKLGYARMPYIGSHVVDSAGVTLIEQWIRSMPLAAGEITSGPITDGSHEATALRAILSGAPIERETEAFRELVKSTEGALALAAAMHHRPWPKASRETPIDLGSAAASSDIRGLFQTFLPESRRRATLGTNVDPQAILRQKGDYQRGKLIYFSDGARCRNCHEVDKPGESLGPTLQEINKKYPRSDELLVHVLQPSLKVDEPLAAYTIVLDDGRSISGLLLEQTDKEIVVKTAEKKLVRLSRDTIEALRKSEKSLMPDFILGDLTAQEAADLFEYIRSLGNGTVSGGR